jgi:hypothetical protein
MGAIGAVHLRSHPPIATTHALLLRRSRFSKAHAHHHYFRILGIRFHPHLRPQGPTLDYVGLFLFAMLVRSEEVYYLNPSLAVVLTPSWAAGIEKVHWRPCLPLNARSALLWALPLGLGAYFLGSNITTEFSSEIGWVVAAVVILFVIYQVVQRLLRTPPHRSH